MDFVAIDFETANEKRNSACSLGIAVVRNNKIVEKKYWLIKPYEMRFEPMNIWIHGITENDVVNEPQMDELWYKIKPYLENSFVIAHNASFDISVLRNTLDSYGISYPNLRYSCTVVMSQTFYPKLANHKLNTVADHLGITFKHHNALEDAVACASILIDILNDLKIDSIEELSDSLGLKIGTLYEDGYICSGKIKDFIPERTSSRKIKTKHIQLENDSLNLGHAFANKIVVFTGPLESMSRLDAMQKIIKSGGKVGSSVTKKTNYLVTGIRSIEKLAHSMKSTKLKKAELLIKNGQDIKILSEDDFLDMFKK